jgi:hypothetical protein
MLLQAASTSSGQLLTPACKLSPQLKVYMAVQTVGTEWLPVGASAFVAACYLPHILVHQIDIPIHAVVLWRLSST